MIEEEFDAQAKEVDGSKKVKLIFEWNEKELEFVNLNSKALDTLIKCLTQNEFYIIMNTICAEELWDYLEITHEGTSQVKKRKINMLIKDFEIFSMNTNEAIDVFFNRFKGMNFKHCGDEQQNIEVIPQGIKFYHLFS